MRTDALKVGGGGTAILEAMTIKPMLTRLADRFLLHVLPNGFKRIRHYGILGPAAKAVKLARAREALLVPAPDPLVVESVAAFMRRIERIEWTRCPHCGQGAFVPMAAIAPMPIRIPFSRGPP